MVGWSLRSLEKMVLQRRFGPKWDYAIGYWRTLRNEELNKFYSSPHIIRINPRRKKLPGHVVRVGKKGIKLNVSRRIILK
jgi:hypothetical protein